MAAPIKDPFFGEITLFTRLCIDMFETKDSLYLNSPSYVNTPSYVIYDITFRSILFVNVI